MKQIFTRLTVLLLLFSQRANTQVVINELYTDPGAGKHEFFELYNTSPSSTPFSVDNLTMVTFFDISGQKGFYVMDLPNMSVASRGFFVGAAALPFNYQGVTGSIATDFNWNSAAFAANNGYLKKWVQGTSNLVDGNLFYDQATLAVNFNDFFYRRTAFGASYSVFLYNNGQLINTFIGGAGGASTVLNDIVNMPLLYVDMTASSTDFTINFSGYGTLPVESVVQDAGSDNGYLREKDGACATWNKSSASVQHSPKKSNGTLIGYSDGSVSVSAAISTGTVATGSVLNYNVVAAPTSYFPIEMQVFGEAGTSFGKLDAADIYFTSSTETVVTDGAFNSTFFPHTANILIAVKTSLGCFDKILFIPNALVLSTKLISFTGNQTTADIKLNWEIATNEIADRFEIQKSINGQNFTSAGIIFATEKTGSQTYSFNTGAPVSGNTIYRLRIFNKNNKVDYSNNISFQTKEETKTQAAIINNPVINNLTLRFNSPGNQIMNVSIIDMAGRRIQQEKFNSNKGNNVINISLSSSLKKGIYLANLSDGINQTAIKFIKQ